LIPRGAIALDSGARRAGVAYNATRQLLAWTEGTNSTLVYLTSLTAPGRRIELKSDFSGLVPYRFSEDGKYLAARTAGRDFLHVWNVETGHMVGSIKQRFTTAIFAAGGRVLVLSIRKDDDHEIGFYDLVHPAQGLRRVPGRHDLNQLVVSPDGALVAASTGGGQVRLFNPARGELIEPTLHGHLNSATAVAFAPDGRRLISTSGGREAVKLWDVGTGQELLTLSGAGSLLFAARWSGDGDVILAGRPWQAWRAPSWDEIAAAEAKGKTEIRRP
jgi:WD40 repeat protein